jgi:hypothetical protein
MKIKKSGRENEDNGEPFRPMYENWNYMPTYRRTNGGKW